MTDREIYSFLCGLKPESKEQERKIIKMMNIAIADYFIANDSSITAYFNEHTVADIINKSSKEWHNEYVRFCMAHNYEPVSQVWLSRETCKKYSVISKVVRIGTTTVRIFKYK